MWLAPGRVGDELEAPLVGLDTKRKRNSASMLSEPAAHLWTRPGPLEGMSVEAVVLSGSAVHVIQELLGAGPGATLEAAT